MAANDVNIRIKAVDDTDKAFRSVKSSLGGLKNAVFSVQGAIAGIIGGATIGTIVQANRSFQSLQASLITFTGSAEAASKQFEVLQKFAATTPFALEEVVGGFNKLIARGINPSIESLTAFGNIASGTGKSLDMFIEAVADAAVGEFERLKEFGIKAKSEGDKVSLTFGGVTKTIGKNSQEMLGYLEQLGQTKFAGSIERQANTIGGAFSNFGDSIATLSVAIGEAGLNDFLVTATREMSRLINVTAQATKANLGLIDVIGITLREAFSGATDSLKIYREELETLRKGRSILDFLGFDLTNSNKEIDDVQKKINILLMSERTSSRGMGFADPRIIKSPVKASPSTQDSGAVKAAADYAKQLASQRAELASLMTVEETRARKGIAEMYRLRDATNESGQAFRNSYAEAKKLRDNVGGAEMIAIRETVEAMKTPLEQFADGIKTVEDSMQDIALRGLSKLEDGLVGLVQGTKSASDAFRDMASSIINDMIRMVIQRQITAPLAGALNNVIGAAFGGAAVPASPRAIGGSVQSGRTHLVGERGPELFIPSASGSIVPNNAMGGGGVTVVQNINVSTGVQQTVRAEIMTLMPQISNAAKSAVAEARLRGGSFGAAMR
jgi:hypothetical protein